MLRFEMDVAAADLAERTIEGVLVPYNEVGTIRGTDYRFRPGSVRAARARTPLLVDHDRGRPVGRLEELIDTEAALLARFRIDATAAGDEALIQAASGSRGSLSVGAEVVASSPDGAVVDVAEALLLEASLLTLGAFAGANVTRVAAEADEPEPGEGPPENPDQEELELEPEPDEPAPPATPDPEEGTMQASHAAPVILAGADRPERELIAGELVAIIVRAQHGEPEARRYLEAALVESISTDVSGLLPPQYDRTVMGDRDVPRVLFETFRSRNLPGVGLLVNKPRWTTPPDGEWAASVDADATSTKVVIGSDSANIERWDWAGAIPWVVVQRSDPSIIDEIYAAAVQDFYSDVEERIAGLLDLVAAGTDTTLGGGIASFYDATEKAPEVILVAPDVWGELADAKALDSSAAAGGVSTGGGLRSSFAGLPIVASGNLAPGTQILASRRALDARVTDPVRLTANAIGALNVELAVVGEGLFDVDFPAEMLKLAPGAAARTARSSKKNDE